MTKEEIAKQAQYATDKFIDQKEVFHQIRHHPQSSLSLQVAHGALLSQRMRGVQQMKTILDSRDDMDWEDYNQHS